MQIKEKLKSNKFRYGANATVLTVMFIIAVILVNMIASVVSDKFPSINIDLSENGQFEISKATKEAIKDINKEISLNVVVYNESPDIYLDELLARYKEINPNITSSYIDPVKNPVAVQKYSGLSSYGTLVVESKERFELIDLNELYGQIGRMENAESIITNAIVAVTSDEEKTILFTTGHGEKEFDTLKKVAENKFFKTNTIDLLKQDEIKDCDILAICAPASDFTQQEISMIEAYAVKGGNIQIYLNPEVSYLPNLNEYIKEWGIEVKNETVYEKNPNNIYQAYNGYLPVICENDYTKELDTGMLYLNSLRLDVLYSDTKGITNYPLLKTTDKATTLIDSADSGISGEYNIAIMSQRVINERDVVKMLVSGGTLYFEELYSNQYVGNGDMAQAVLKGMLSSEDYVEIETKTSKAQALQMSVTQVIYTLVVLLLVAIGILVFGIIVWSKRRYL